jgi:hypothetical protein
VTADIEHRRAGETEVRQESRARERSESSSGRGNDLEGRVGRDPAERRYEVVLGKRERDQRRKGRRDAVSEGARERVPLTVGSGFWNAHSARG